jgi:hypothetical protein
MLRQKFWLPLIVITFGSATAWGQGGATTVQLPTFNFTTVNTTVTVPDGGTVLLGGIDRAREGQVSRGVPLLGKVPGVNRLFRNEGIGREFSSSSFSVTARIIILEEEEERQVGRVLAQRDAMGGSRYVFDPVADPKADFLSRNLARHPADEVVSQPESKLPSVEEIQRRNELAQQQRSVEAVSFFEKAKSLEAEGKSNVAKVYYDMAARRSSGAFKEEIVARIEALEGRGNSERVAASGR